MRVNVHAFEQYFSNTRVIFFPFVFDFTRTRVHHTLSRQLWGAGVEAHKVEYVWIAGNSGAIQTSTLQASTLFSRLARKIPNGNVLARRTCANNARGSGWRRRVYCGLGHDHRGEMGRGLESKKL